MAANKTVGGINVTITASIDKFAKAMTMGRRLMTKFVTGIKNLVFSLKGLAVALAAGAFTKLVTNQMEAIDSLAKTADKLNVTTEALAGLQLAADEAGISNQVLEKALTMVVRNTADASQGVGEAATAYKQLGLNAKELNRLSPDKQFLEIADAISKVNNKQTQLALTTDIFGARAASMITLIRGGRAALDEAAVAAVSLGLAIDRKTAAGVERAIDAFGRFKMAVSGIFRSLAAEIAPYIEILSNKATSLLASGGNGKGIGAGIAQAIIRMAKFVADGIQKMVQAVLGLVSDTKALFLQFRLDAPSWLGVGFKGQGDKAAAFASFDASRKAYGRSLGWERPSVGIDRMLADMQKKADQPTGPNPAFARMFGNARDGLLGSNAAQNAMQIGGNLWKGFAGGLQSLPRTFLGLQWQAMQMQARNWPGAAAGGASNPALTLAQSGSVESYRQQAAIRRQGENIQKKQLGVQEKMAVALANIDKKTMPTKALGLA